MSSIALKCQLWTNIFSLVFVGLKLVEIHIRLYQWHIFYFSFLWYMFPFYFRSHRYFIESSGRPSHGMLIRYHPILQVGLQILYDTQHLHPYVIIYSLFAKKKKSQRKISKVLFLPLSHCFSVMSAHSHNFSWIRHVSCAKCICIVLERSWSWE